MSFFQFLFPIATVILSALCYVCYKTNKPLREKAKAEAKEKELKELKEAQEAFVKLQRDELRLKVFSDIELALNDPHVLIEKRYLASGRGGNYRWKALAQLAHVMKDNQSVRAVIGDQEARLDAQAKTIRDLKGQIKEIHRLLEVYA